MSFRRANGVSSKGSVLDAFHRLTSLDTLQAHGRRHVDTPGVIKYCGRPRPRGEDILDTLWIDDVAGAVLRENCVKKSEQKFSGTVFVHQKTCATTVVC